MNSAATSKMRQRHTDRLCVCVSKHSRPPPPFTDLQFPDHPLDEVVSKLHPLQASLCGGDGVEDGRVYLVDVLLAVKSGKLPDDALKAGGRLSVGKTVGITHPQTRASSLSVRELRPKCENHGTASPP